MKGNLKHVGKFALIIGALVGSQALASPLCTSLTTLAEYENNTCHVGTIQFTFSGPGNAYFTTGFTVPETAVNVTVVGDGTTAGVPVGFIFTTNPGGQWTASDGTVSDADVHIRFSAAMNTNPLEGPVAPVLRVFSSTTLTLDSLIAYSGCNPAPYPPGGIATCPNFTGTTGIIANESVSDISSNNLLPGISMVIVGNSDAESINNGGAALTGTSAFFARDLEISKNVALIAGDTASSITLNGVTETFLFSDAPEPGPFVLAGAGLLAFVLLRRKKAAAGVLAIGALAVLSSPNASANPVCVNNTTLAALEGTTCSFNGIDFGFDANAFTQIARSTSPTNSSTNLLASSVQVAWSDDPAHSAVQINFNFSAQTIATGFLQYDIVYTVSAPQTITKFVYTANNSVSHTALTTATFGGTPTNPLVSETDVKAGASTLYSSNWVNTTASGNFSSTIGPNTLLQINSTVDQQSSGGTGLTTSTHMSGLQETFVITPEPVTVVMFGSALTFLGLMGRRNKNKK